MEAYRSYPYFFTKQALNDYKECIRLSKFDPSPMTRDWELGCDRSWVLFTAFYREYKDSIKIKIKK